MSLIDFQFLFQPVEQFDAWLTGLFDGASLLVALGIAFVLGVRHASDPDHLVAVTSLVAADEGEREERPPWSMVGPRSRRDVDPAGRAIDRLQVRASRLAGERRGEGGRGRDRRPGAPGHVEVDARGLPGGPHLHAAGRVAAPPAPPTRESTTPTTHRLARTPQQAFGIGLLHGLAGTGAVVVLLLAALPTQLEAGLALGVFAPMTIVSMAACTTAFAWVLTRRWVEPVYRTVLIPILGLFGLMFGLWYVGVG